MGTIRLSISLKTRFFCALGFHMRRVLCSLRVSAANTSCGAEAETHRLPPSTDTLFPKRTLRPAKRPRSARLQTVTVFLPDDMRLVRLLWRVAEAGTRSARTGWAGER